MPKRNKNSIAPFPSMANQINRVLLIALIPASSSISMMANGQTLSEAMQSALDAHPEIQAGINARLAAEEQMNAAKSAYLPQIDFLGSYGREGTDSPGTRGLDHNKTNLNREDSALRLQQMLFDGFATRSDVRRQLAITNTKAYELLGTSERTALNVAQIYLDVLKRQELVRLAEYNLKNHERIYGQISLRSRSGIGRNVDLDQAEARLAQARNNLITEQTGLADAHVGYYSIVGNQPLELTPPAELKERIPETLQDARMEMLTHNPILISAEFEIQSAEEQYLAAKSSLYPHFDAEITQGFNNNQNGIQGHNNQWSAMLNMRYNLFSGGRNKYDIQSKAYQTNQALDIRNNSLRLLNEDLGIAWNTYQNAQKQLPIAKQYVDYSNRVRKSYQLQFSLGDRTLLDLLDSENELFIASRRLEEVKFHGQFSQYWIKATTGSLLKSVGITAPIASIPLDDTKARNSLPNLK